ncbi:tubulin--tyrosine ligase-like protein 12 [Coccinella septempunctata]|uniref:tubulin--tyrosine ligase-like protein 12 n=1 Tax=Coccinella septempunctata TaxID=41139 RepID=UPI001D08C0A1|nr:tubulin--tyrosine ligase-like protein 12 [Coccinella septempunctata]
MGHACDWDFFINIHKEQLVSSGVPQIFWRTIYEKLLTQTFDIGNVVQLLQFEKEENSPLQDHPIWGLQCTSAINKSDSKNVFLIDHAWTFRLENSKNQLVENEKLRKRMASLLNLDCSLPVKELCERIYDNMWPLCFSYTISNASESEDRLPVWYIMDEIGSALIHNNEPNCRIVPFYFSNEQITYSILFPLEDIDEDEFLYRDFAEGVQNEQDKNVLLLPWRRSDIHYSLIPRKPTVEYFLEGHIRESLPNLEYLQNFNKTQYHHNKKLKVFAQYSLVRDYLSHDLFELVEDKDAADISWLTEHFKNFEEFSDNPEKFVNQFPFEYVITIKDLLSITCRKDGEESIENFWPPWMPITYNLKTELGNFVSYYRKRELESLDNTWIIKPFNLARGMDTHITNNLNCIIRLSTTTPKIVQKYISNPVLFHRPDCNGYVKFDIRYVLLLKSVKPLKAFIYKKFFLRFSNIPFELNDFDVYEKHFTVMNYNQNSNLKHMLCEEFLSEWSEQYSQHSWDEIENKITSMLKQILEKATSCEPPCGIAESPQSRALYAADIILEWDKNFKMQPKILEINWTPDCKRACEYYPDFFNDIFQLLFLDRESPNIKEI